MNRLLSARLLALFAFSALPAAAAEPEPELKSWLGSAFIVPGEETELWLSLLSDTRPDNLPQAPRVPDATIRFESDPVYPQRAREELLYIYKFSIRSYTEGTHTIPPFEATVQGRPLRSQPVTLHVSTLPENAWSTHRVHDEVLRYAGAVFTPRRIPYEGETFPSEAKVYLPHHVAVTEGSIAELDHDGVAAWRFEASKLPYTRLVFQTSVRIDGQDYVGVAFGSTATPIRAGPVSLGPGHARIELGVQFQSRGLNLRQNIAARLPIPQREFEVRPLPPNAPPGFGNAVGSFTLAAIAEIDDLRDGDSISLRLSVAGLGNLDNLAAPQFMADESEWKVYPPSRLERQGERRDVSGVVTFSQIVRPLGDQRIIPPFRLVAFDPELERYTTATTPPIPFEVSASTRAAPPSAILPDVETPVEAMEGILGIIDPRPPRPAETTPPWWRSWHLVPALLGLLLLGRIAQRRLLPRLHQPSREKDVLRALASVEHAGPAARPFLRAAGTFIESWVPDDQRDEELDAILARRDRDCFRPDADNQVLGNDEHRTMLDHLRKCALASLSLLVVLLTLLPAAPAPAQSLPPDTLYRQAAAAWDEAAYHAAIDLYRRAHPAGPLPADVHYNIANCYFQLGERGLAALHFRRALLHDPRHPEARQNLRFLKRKTGAIIITRPAHQDWLAHLDRSVFATALHAGLWMSALAVLGLFAAPGKHLRIIIWSGFALGPFAALAGGVGLSLYPDDAAFAPPAEQAVVITPENTVARTEAAIDGEVVITVPPGSLCRLLAQRGPWTYVELADRTRGWLPANELEPLVPRPAPAAPAAADLGA